MGKNAEEKTLGWAELYLDIQKTIKIIKSQLGEIVGINVTYVICILII